MRRIKDYNLSDEESAAIQRAIRGSLDLYRRYVSLNPEHDFKPAVMKRKQTDLRKKIVLLEEGMRKLRAYRTVTVKE